MLPLRTPQSVLDYSPDLYPVPMSPTYALLAKIWLWPSNDDDDDGDDYDDDGILMKKENYVPLLTKHQIVTKT